MRYHNITKCDMLNGPGLRVVLWVAGCEHHCKNCHNPMTWDINGGIPFDEKARQELFDELKTEYTDGITLSGGDPLHLCNRKEMTQLAKEIKEKFPKKSIWLYTGYTYEEIQDLEILQYIDVLIDGKFVEELKDESLPWRGSSNQNIIHLNKGEVVFYEWDAKG